MRHPWPTAPLGEVITERKEQPTAEDLALGNIKIVEKISFDSGLIQLRTGGETKTKMILARPGDLLVSGINAAKGAIALYDDQNIEPIAATIHYGAYIPNQYRVSVKFLWWLLRSQFFKELLLEHVPGGIKTELKAKRLLPVPIPLPPLIEQHRIVAEIEVIANQILEAQRLRQESSEAFGHLVTSIHISLAGTRKRKLSEVLRLEEDAVAVSYDEEYPQVGVRSFGAGLFAKSATPGNETSYKAFNRLYSGAVLLSQVKGWEGAIAVCPSHLDGWFVSPEYRTFRCVDSESSPGYFAELVRTEWFWSKLSLATRGVGARRERTRPEQFLSLEMPMPDYAQQLQAERCFSELHHLRHLSSEMTTELDVLLPAVLDKAFRGEL